MFGEPPEKTVAARHTQQAESKARVYRTAAVISRIVPLSPCDEGYCFFPVCICRCICVICTCKYVYMCVFQCVYVCVFAFCMRICMCVTFVCAYICVCLDVGMCIYVIVSVCVCVIVRVFLCARVWMCLCVCVCVWRLIGSVCIYEGVCVLMRVAGGVDGREVIYLTSPSWTMAAALPSSCLTHLTISLHYHLTSNPIRQLFSPASVTNLPIFYFCFLNISSSFLASLLTSPDRRCPDTSVGEMSARGSAIS